MPRIISDEDFDALQRLEGRYPFITDILARSTECPVPSTSLRRYTPTDTSMVQTDEGEWVKYNDVNAFLSNFGDEFQAAQAVIDQTKQPAPSTEIERLVDNFEQATLDYSHSGDGSRRKQFFDARAALFTAIAALSTQNQEQNDADLFQPSTGRSLTRRWSGGNAVPMLIKGPHQVPSTDLDAKLTQLEEAYAELVECPRDREAGDRYDTGRAAFLRSVVLRTQFQELKRLELTNDHEGTRMEVYSEGRFVRYDDLLEL